MSCVGHDATPPVVRCSPHGGLISGFLTEQVLRLSAPVRLAVIHLLGLPLAAIAIDTQASSAARPVQPQGLRRRTGIGLVPLRSLPVRVGLATTARSMALLVGGCRNRVARRRHFNRRMIQHQPVRPHESQAGTSRKGTRKYPHRNCGAQRLWPGALLNIPDVTASPSQPLWWMIKPLVTVVIST